MKSKQIIHLVGLIALLIVAVIVDLAYYHIGFDTEIPISLGLIEFLVHFRGLILIGFYAALFIVEAPLISKENPSRLQTWIILVIGLVIVFLVGVLPYGRIDILRFIRDKIFGSLQDQILLFDHAYLKLVLHYGAIMTALGLYLLGRQFRKKKQELK